jgi:hypothetical protein
MSGNSPRASELPHWIDLGRLSPVNVGSTLPTWAVPQVGGNLGYTGPCVRSAFERPPAGGRNSHALDFRRPAACTHSFGLHVREPVTDKFDQHGEPEAARGPERPGAPASRRPVQHFERAPLLCIEPRLLRGRRHRWPFIALAPSSRLRQSSTMNAIRLFVVSARGRVHCRRSKCLPAASQMRWRKRRRR